MSILGRTSHNEAPQCNPRKDSHVPSLPRGHSHVHGDSRTEVSGTASSGNWTGMGHPGAGGGPAALTRPPLGRALTCWGRSQTAAPARRAGPGHGDATPSAAGGKRHLAGLGSPSKPPKPCPQPLPGIRPSVGPSSAHGRVPLAVAGQAQCQGLRPWLRLAPGSPQHVPQPNEVITAQ